MKVAIDTSCLLINPNCGLSEVVHNLVSELPFVESGNRFILYYNFFRSEKKTPNHRFPGTSNYISRVPRRIVNWLWKFDRPHINLFLPKAEIYHSLHVQIPPSNRLKRILTVHDCRYLAFPELYSPQVVDDYRRIMYKSLERADMVATVSKSTRQELLTHFTITEDQIKVIYNGFKSYVPNTTTNAEMVQEFIQKLGLPNSYLIFIGALDPRKNLKRLIEALSILKQEESDIPGLVISGISSRQWNKSDEAKEADRLGLLKNIYVIGVLDKDLLFGVMQKSTALCYPSLYEGFGFPPLEAMSQGIPVLAGKNSSIPEVTGDAACLVDPMNVDEIAKGLRKIIFDNDYRERLVEKGFAQIKKFSWRKTATEYIRLYKQVLAL